MAIAKGEQWGEPGTLSPDAAIATSDAEAARLGSASSPIGLRSGDLARTLGIRQPYDPTSPKHMVAVDVVAVELDDGTEHMSVAHVVLGNLPRSRHVVALMNAAFVGRRNIAPRAHPGDGKVDVVRLDLDPADRVKAWKRMTTGTHVPHPGIEIRQRTEGVVELDRPRPVRVDGAVVGHSSQARFRVIPAAILIAVS